MTCSALSSKLPWRLEAPSLIEDATSVPCQVVPVPLRWSVPLVKWYSQSSSSSLRSFPVFMSRMMSRNPDGLEHVLHPELTQDASELSHRGQPA